MCFVLLKTTSAKHNKNSKNLGLALGVLLFASACHNTELVCCSPFTWFLILFFHFLPLLLFLGVLFVYLFNMRDGLAPSF
jgi:hypothetical protein